MSKKSDADSCRDYLLCYLVLTVGNLDTQYFSLNLVALWCSLSAMYYFLCSTFSGLGWLKEDSDDDD